MDGFSDFCEPTLAAFPCDAITRRFNRVCHVCVCAFSWSQKDKRASRMTMKIAWQFNSHPLRATWYMVYVQLHHHQGFGWQFRRVRAHLHKKQNQTRKWIASLCAHIECFGDGKKQNVLPSRIGNSSERYTSENNGCPVEAEREKAAMATTERYKY